MTEFDEALSDAGTYDDVLLDRVLGEILGE